MDLILMSLIKDIDKNTLTKPFLDYGIIGVLVIIFGFVIYKMYFAHKAEIAQMAIDRDNERNELISKLDAARADALNDIKVTNLQVIDIVNKFNDIANELRNDYYKSRNV